MVFLLQTSTSSLQTSRPHGERLSRESLLDDLLGSLKGVPARPRSEDRHWQEIESRLEASQSGGGEKWISVGKATSLYATDGVHKHGENVRLNRSHGKDEELELGIALQSETESQIYSQNDMDSGRFGNLRSPQNVRNIQQRPESNFYSPVRRNSDAPLLPRNGPPTQQVRGSGNVPHGFVDTLDVHDTSDDMMDTHRDVSQNE